MSTNDVPGHRAENRDELAMGCWAEHQDGSLIFVQSTEGGRVIYSIFDMSRSGEVIEYRDAMPETSFKRTFSWDGKSGTERWTWHDKTPFPWDRVIKAGATDGMRHASASDTLNAAQRVAQSLQLRARDFDRDMAERFGGRERPRGDTDILARIETALDELPGRIASAMRDAE